MEFLIYLGAAVVSVWLVVAVLRWRDERRGRDWKRSDDLIAGALAVFTVCAIVGAVYVAAVRL